MQILFDERKSNASNAPMGAGTLSQTTSYSKINFQ
jgi:hypothetical protein